jgi:hypothetical protein
MPILEASIMMRSGNENEAGASRLHVDRLLNLILPDHALVEPVLHIMDPVVHMGL